MNPRATVTLISGFPGAGKTEYAQARLGSVCFFDDFMGGGGAGFRRSLHYERVCRLIASGTNIALADVQLTQRDFYEDTVRALRDVTPNLVIRTIVLGDRTGSPEKCFINIALRYQRGLRTLQEAHDEIAGLNQLSGSFHVPPDAVVLEVFNPQTEMRGVTLLPGLRRNYRMFPRRLGHFAEELHRICRRLLPAPPRLSGSVRINGTTFTGA